MLVSSSAHWHISHAKTRPTGLIPFSVRGFFLPPNNALLMIFNILCDIIY